MNEYRETGEIDLNKYKPCTLLRVNKEFSTPPSGMVKRGDVVGDTVILYAKPSPCVCTPSTRVDVISVVKVEVEKRGNIVIFTARPSLTSGRDVDYYIYPRRLVEDIEAKYFEPLVNDKPPVNPGILFVGSPGTGKSTMIELIANTYGFVSYSLDPSLLSEYVGRTEHNVAQLLETAEKTEPALIKADEAEWWLRARSQAGDNSGMSQIMSGVINILLRKMQEWKNKGIKVLIAGATNYDPRTLDQAFLRPGRFGKPIVVPLPDYEILKAFYELYGVKEADKLARISANAGYNMSEAYELVELYKAGKPIRIEPKKQRGYARLTTPPLESLFPDVEWKKTVTGKPGKKENIFDDISNILPPAIFNSPYTRVEVIGKKAETIAMPILAYYLQSIGKTVILLWTDDPKEIDEALAGAEYGNSVVFVRVDYINPRYIHLKTSVPVVYFTAVGTRLQTFVLADDAILQFLKVKHRKELFKMLFEFYEISYTNKDLEKIMDATDKELEKIFSIIHLYSKSSVQAMYDGLTSLYYDIGLTMS
ncbi:MAG: ATP-binding protein [Ignisphaera sp.]